MQCKSEGFDGESGDRGLEKSRQYTEKKNSLNGMALLKSDSAVTGLQNEADGRPSSYKWI